MAKKKKKKVNPPSPEYKEYAKLLKEIGQDSPDKLFQKPSTNPETMRFSEKIDRITDNLMLRLSKDYYNKMQKDHLMLTKEELDALDFVDLRGMLESKMVKTNTQTTTIVNQISSKIADWSMAHYPYSAIPCFTKGAYKDVNDHFMVFQILDFDPNMKYYTARCQSYIYSRNVLSYTMDVTFQVVLDKHPDDDHSINIISFIPSADINSMALSGTLGWNNDEKNLWKRFAVKAQVRSEDETVNIYQAFVSCFLNYTGITNYYLSRKRDKIASDQDTEKQPSKRQDSVFEKDFSELKTPDKIIRTFGPITTGSANRPKMPTKATIIHYRTNEWTTRGHIRRYKSGKTIYIKPHSNKRKKEMTRKTPQTIFILKERKES